MKSYLFWVVGLLAGVMIFACKPPQEETQAETPPRAVLTRTIVSQDLPIVVRAVGRLTPDREVVISAEVPGILEKYDADVGSKVAKGDRLAQIEAVDYRLALKEAEANLLAAQIRLPVTKNSFERAKRLLPEKAITEELYEQAEAAYASAQATVTQLETMVAMAQRRLDKTTITAPFDGHVTQRFIEKGQNVAAGSPVMQVADTKTMRVKIYINELDYVYVDKDDPVTVTVEAFDHLPMAGRVDKIGIQADSRTNTFEVEILMDNPDFTLKAGLTARVAIETRVIPDAILIAQSSVLFRENRKEVFVVNGDRMAQVREVKLGQMVGSDVQILEGLQPGDDLVVSGAQYLKTGDKVTVIQ